MKSEKTLQEQLKHYRLNQEEYSQIQSLLGREPQGVEWALFSALWSEHCSYKSSKVHLKKLFSQSPRVLQSFGENAGIVDLGDGEKVAFKMESHNHPSFIEPYQGAATGVGGILRDIFTMGARPIALANYLCFGEPQAPRMSRLVDGVVRGIGGYGNCVGVPTVTGQTHFHRSYNENILVNAMAVGYFGAQDPICLSKAKGVGNYVVYVGAKTGRDGIHGASMASESFSEDSASKRPTVQIGDPFFEKLLIEACLEVMKKDLVVAIQDMGAAGLTSSSFEMAEKGGVGIEMDLDKVPLRDSTLTPEDILLSESQERMLLVCEPSRFAELQKEFLHWDLDACIIGQVTEGPKVRLRWHGEILTEMDPQLIVGSAPQYQRPFETAPRSFTQAKPMGTSPLTAMDWKSVLQGVDGCAREWIYRQYDQRVGAATAKDCSDAVGVVRLKESGRALGVVLGCRPHLMRQDTYWGGADAVLHPSLQLAVMGFEPLAVTDCLNFGNPEKRETMTQFVSALTGMNEACKSLKTPIISGNVSFYNETQNKNVTPTPSTGLVGLRPSIEALPQTYFNDRCHVYTINLHVDHQQMGWSHGFIAENTKTPADGYLPENGNLVAEKIPTLVELGRTTLVESARVVGKYGLLYALMRMSLKGVGCKVDSTQDPWMEPFYQIVVATRDPQKLEEFLKIKKMNFTKIGITQKEKLEWGSWSCATSEIQKVYGGSWEGHFEGLA